MSCFASPPLSVNPPNFKNWQSSMGISVTTTARAAGPAFFIPDDYPQAAKESIFRLAFRLVAVISGKRPGTLLPPL
jgi:hypothetical protein